MMDRETFSSRLIETLRALEGAFRRTDPILLARIRGELLGYEAPLRSGREAITGAADGPEGTRALHLAAGHACEAIRLFGDGEGLTLSFLNVLKAFRKFCRAQEALFTLRHELAQVDRYFLEPAVHDSAGMNDPVPPSDAGTGIIHAGMENEPYARGGYSLYVPESYHPGRSWPLVVALHGGYGHGRDFIWTWLREARSRGFVLMAPTSRETTWSIARAGHDAGPLLRHLEEVSSCYSIDRSRVLITGMSDGATFGLCLGLEKGSPFTAMAPVSGVLASAGLGHARGRRIHWVHGVLDWMFPVERAVQACRALKEAGADVRLHVIKDLSHAYPREANAVILEWFDPSLSLNRPA